MIYGIGIDLIEIERVQRLNDKQPKLIERILSPGEQQRYHSFSSERRKLEFLAGRFTTKEAFSKALGTGLGKTVAFHDIHCYNDDYGKPCIDYPGFKVHVSITHSDHYAMSQVLLEKMDEAAYNKNKKNEI
ncbi:holo-ACP synthase [Staphylococcus lugdunensis]|uniref:Holo-[acyl-carrier-protein] synthase n=1 Tax=Staphylococcus lugdunensis TaxID=28035 RepID=A0A133Q817_STALU|nr:MULTISPECIES: holo-ACP synthase [Staphylococcus]ADC87083.1 Holo-[acyl-carrier protein] synthase [Staphylococcus lugdunensis HKU09-01]AMG62499.1 4'-phosphopantetheinyl transferase [Staphylococcus lugdunensis]AMG63579.1 holo-ACP synthase [Staphylococcus lugdunensis]ARB77351.1 holo-ACP synthase [Staphylococcus lugdunensis]ARJ08864.1 holo-ACP synthase [Staphylococcus lugdunensis]